MLQLHVVLDQSKNWLDYVPSWVTAVAALLTVFVAVLIARNQSKIQKKLAEKQIEIQKSQMEQQERQLKKDLFDRRFAVFDGVLDFISYVLREDGNIRLVGPGEYKRFCDRREMAKMLFGDDVNKYLADVDEVARNLYVSAKGRDKATATGDGEAIQREGQLWEHLTGPISEKRVELFRPYLTL